MKYELTFYLLLVRLKGRERNRHGAFGTKAESAFPNPGIHWPPDQGIIHTTFPRRDCISNTITERYGSHGIELTSKGRCMASQREYSVYECPSSTVATYVET